MPSYMKLHTETTPVFDLPEDIYYAHHQRGQKGKLLITGFRTIRSATYRLPDKCFSINKYTLEIAYQKIIEFVYGDKASEIIKKFPIPYIHPDDLFIFARKNKNYVYGVNINDASISGTVLGFAVREKDTVNKNKYFSISKLGLEKAWSDAVAYRYSYSSPLPTDKPELPLEYWDMINPKYKTKKR